MRGAGVESVDDALVDVVADDRQTGAGGLSGKGESDVAEAKDRNSVIHTSPHSDQRPGPAGAGGVKSIEATRLLYGLFDSSRDGL
ncbi:hypothetical protein GCM10022199_13890 [Marihabitans asiaticum]|uniref:Uncharacterized protein n=1 Tax=Marihabitans asiaticum TaxID=415218 RepID=A0A560W8G7_9MICO|nr:hypothetical protein FB557_2560 [Marihabitans asiaticum]